MPLRPASELFAGARSGHYALGYFESWNIESLQGVIDAAEQTRSPIIIGFSGEFLTRPGRLTEERIEWYGALGRAAAESCAVPCGLIFNECPGDEYVRQAILSNSFNLVMLADAEASHEDYTQRVAGLAQIAHQHGVAFEAEIDELPSGSSGKVLTHHSQLTHPDLASAFITATGIDLLSVSVGNVHIMVDGQQALNLDHLAEIRKKVDIPLGLHGGSGISPDSLRAAIQLGVVKVNYGTYVKQRYLTAVRKALACREVNPHLLLGMGGAEDVLVAGRLAVRDAVLERIEILGCSGKA
jgi:ketose-bisphosphate aldolase